MDATPEHPRDWDPPRPATVWAGKKVVVTIPGHRDQGLTQPRNLVDQPPMAQVLPRMGATISQEQSRAMRHHGSRRLWEQAQSDAVIAEAVHIPQRRQRPNSIQIRARAATLNDVTATSPSGHTSYRDSVLSPSLRARSSSSPLLPPKTQTLMDQHDLFSRAPRVQSRGTLVNWETGNSQWARRGSMPHVRQWMQKRGKDVPTMAPDPDMEPAWRYQRFYDAPVSTQRRPTTTTRQQPVRRLIVEAEHPAASAELLARAPMPMPMTVERRSSRVDRASLRSTTSKLSRRVSTLIRRRPKALSEATALEKVYRASRFHENMDEECLRQHRAENSTDQRSPKAQSAEPSKRKRTFSKPSFSSLRKWFTPSRKTTPQQSQRSSFSHSRGYCTTNDSINEDARAHSSTTTCPEQPQSFSHTRGYRTTSSTINENARARSSTIPNPTLRPTSARYNHARSVSAGPNTLPKINEERPSPPSTTSSNAPRPSVPHTDTSICPPQPQSLRPLRQYSAHQVQWTTQMAHRAFEDGIEHAAEAEVQRMDEWEASGQKGVTGGGRRAWPFPETPLVVAPDSVSSAESGLMVARDDAWWVGAVGEVRKRLDAQRRYEGGESRLRVVN